MINENNYKDIPYFERGNSNDIWLHSSMLRHICPSDGGRLAYLLHHYETRDDGEEKEHHRTGHLLHSYMENPKNIQVEDTPEITPMSADWALDVKKKMDEGDIRPPEEIAITSKEELGVHAGVKDPVKIKEKFRKTCSDYLDYLKRIGESDKIIISKAQKEFLRGAVENLKDETVKSYIEPVYEEIELKEHEIFFPLGYLDGPKFNVWFNCKAKIDKLLINKQYKTIKIIDYKTDKGRATTFNGYSITTDKVRYTSPGPMGFYKIPRQLAFYGLAVRDYLRELGEDPDSYIFLYTVVVFEKNPPYLVVPFTIGDTAINEAQSDIDSGIINLAKELIKEGEDKSPQWHFRGINIEGK